MLRGLKRETDLSLLLKKEKLERGKDVTFFAEDKNEVKKIVDVLSYYGINTHITKPLENLYVIKTRQKAEQSDGKRLTLFPKRITLYNKREQVAHHFFETDSVVREYFITWSSRLDEMLKDKSERIGLPLAAVARRLSIIYLRNRALESAQKHNKVKMYLRDYSSSKRYVKKVEAALHWRYHDADGVMKLAQDLNVFLERFEEGVKRLETLMNTLAWRKVEGKLKSSGGENELVALKLGLLSFFTENAVSDEQFANVLKTLNTLMSEGKDDKLEERLQSLKGKRRVHKDTTYAQLVSTVFSALFFESVNGVDASLLLSIAVRESNVRPSVYNNKGAIGLYQLTPVSAASLLTHSYSKRLVERSTGIKKVAYLGSMNMLNNIFINTWRAAETLFLKTAEAKTSVRTIKRPVSSVALSRVLTRYGGWVSMRSGRHYVNDILNVYNRLV
jgi:uncharacterized lipoprotein YmbA